METVIEKKNFDSYNDLYQTMEYDHEYPNTNLVRLEKWFLKNPGVTLDHGCGYGENLIFMTSKGYKVHGVDVSENLINWIDLKCRLRKIPKDLFSLKKLDPNEPKLPFPDQYFDHILSLGVLQLMGNREMAKSCIRELSRTLKAGGKMIVSIQAPENSFVYEAKKLDNEEYYWEGAEAFKRHTMELNLYIPSSKESFASIFPHELTVNEVGSWDNDYCGVRGMHFVALATKNF